MFVVCFACGFFTVIICSFWNAVMESVKEGQLVTWAYSDRLVFVLPCSVYVCFRSMWNLCFSFNVVFCLSQIFSWQRANHLLASGVQWLELKFFITLVYISPVIFYVLMFSLWNASYGVSKYRPVECLSLFWWTGSFLPCPLLFLFSPNVVFSLSHL
jgi:hypothetical protein